VTELVTESWRLCAPKRLLTAYDAEHPPIPRPARASRGPTRPAASDDRTDGGRSGRFSVSDGMHNYAHGSADRSVDAEDCQAASPWWIPSSVRTEPANLRGGERVV
jgi:hypothetical protein